MNLLMADQSHNGILKKTIRLKGQQQIHGEHFIQWVIENKFANDMPALDEVGVELVDQVNPYEEAKIRILNGGHTALCYLGALAKLNTFDQVMADKTLRSHFDTHCCSHVCCLW